MKSFKEPSFEDRVKRAAEARQKALEKLKARPPRDEKVVAERLAAQQKKAAMEAEKKAAKKQAREEAKILADAEKAKAAPVPKPELTEAERKALRDARYAARKARK